MWTVKDAGIEETALWRYIEEQVYSLPGTEHHRDVFSVLLTGSRAVGNYVPDSDVDIDVLCPQAVYASVQKAALEAGIIQSENGFWLLRTGEDLHRYFGEEVAVPHISIHPLDTVARQLAEFDDVALWIWSNARALTDPNGQFQRVVETFTGYPPDVLVRKIEYRHLLYLYWTICAFPLHSAEPCDLLPAATSLVNAVNELLRLFFLVERKPFPYTEKLMSLARATAFGKQLGPRLQQVVDLAVGVACPEISPWERLRRASDLVMLPDLNENPGTPEQAFLEAVLAAGVGEHWLENDFDNIDDLLSGRLGPTP